MDMCSSCGNYEQIKDSRYFSGLYCFSCYFSIVEEIFEEELQTKNEK